MVNYREIIRLKCLEYDNSRVSRSCGCSRNTVAEVWQLAMEKDLGWPIPDALTNKDLQQILYPERIGIGGRKLPDYEYVHKELSKPGVTLSLLWAEYCAQCTSEHTIPYQHSQFNEKYHAFAASKKATLRINHKPGEAMEVDWVGDTLIVFDELSGESMKAYVFVACLPCSLYSYSEAFPDMKSNHWIQAHVHAYNFFGGVTRILVNDNLKTGVISNTRTELVLNRSYYEMAEYYGTEIIPTRPVRPCDKPSAEGTVKVIETWIMAALRNRKFFSFEELNQAIREKLIEFNSKPFQKSKEAGSLRSKMKKKNSSYRYLLLRMKRLFGQKPPYNPIISYRWENANIPFLTNTLARKLRFVALKSVLKHSIKVIGSHLT